MLIVEKPKDMTLLKDCVFIDPIVRLSFCFLPEAVCFHLPEHSTFTPAITLRLETLTAFKRIRVAFEIPEARLF